MKNVFLSFLFCILGCSSGDDSDTNSDRDADDNTETDLSSNCPKNTVEHTTSSGKTVCCDKDEAIFCDDNNSGYSGGCWPAGVDCATITLCGEKWAACPDDTVPFCSETGTLSCETCPEGSVLYETNNGYPSCCDDEYPQFYVPKRLYIKGSKIAGDMMDTSQERLRVCRARNREYLSLGHDRPATARFVFETAGVLRGPAFDIGTGKGLLDIEPARCGLEVVILDVDATAKALQATVERLRAISGIGGEAVSP